MNRGGPSLPMPRRRGIPPQKARKSRNPSTDGRELRYLPTKAPAGASECGPRLLLARRARALAVGYRVRPPSRLPSPPRGERVAGRPGEGLFPRAHVLGHTLSALRAWKVVAAATCLAPPATAQSHTGLCSPHHFSTAPTSNILKW